MSIFVALSRTKLPSAAAWAEKIRAEKFAVTMDEDFDTQSFSGFLPCPDSTTGFEYYIEGLRPDLESLPLAFAPSDRKRFVGFDTVVEFCFKTEGDMHVAQVASAVLATITGGLVVDGESGAILTAEEALRWARGTYEPDSPPVAVTKPTAKKRTSPVLILRIILFIVLAGAVLVRWLRK